MQVMLEETSAALLSAHEGLAAAVAATGGVESNSVINASSPNCEHAVNDSAKAALALQDILNHTFELLPHWAGSLTDPASDCADDPHSIAVSGGTAHSGNNLLERVTSRVMSSYKLSCSLGSGESRVAEGTKAVTMQLLEVLQHMAV